MPTYSSALRSTLRRGALAAVLVVSAAGTLAASAQASDTLTSVIPNVSNCCTDSVNTGSWNVTNVNGSSASGGKVQFGSFVVNMPVSTNDMVYFHYVAVGIPLTSVLFTTPTIDYCMEKVFVDGVRTNADGTDDVTFVPAQMYEINPTYTGTSPVWSGFSWDISTNTEASSSTKPCGVA